MPAIKTPLDLASRALQHVGARRLDAADTTVALWAADTDLGASETYFVYDKVRQAELRRNIWRFSTRRCALRPIAASTSLVIFGTWSAGTASAGDIVLDSNGNPWIALASTTVQPGPTAWPAWEEFAGPQTIDDWDASISYYTGELAIGSDNNVYSSLEDGNLNNDPTATDPWNALSIQPTLQSIFVPYPVSASQFTAGSVTQAPNIYYQPTRFLRVAPQDPKVAGVSNQQVFAGQMWSDLEFEDTFILTSQTSPLILRFAADIETIARFDPMFSEGVAARMGKEIAAPDQPRLRSPLCCRLPDGDG